MENQGVAERIKFLIDLKSQGNVSAFAKATGLSRTILYAYMTKSSPSVEAAAKIAVFTGCDLNWLITGQGTAPGEASAQGVVGKAAETAALYGVQEIDDELLAALIVAAQELVAEEKLKMEPRDLAKRVALAYKLEKEKDRGEVKDRMRGLVKLGGEG